MTGIERLVDIVNDGPYSGGMIHISVQKLREICEQIEREVADISGYKSAVVAFVEEHGGIEVIKERLLETIPHAVYDRIYRRKNRRIRELEEELEDMRGRLMPEGMEWPMFENLEPVRIGDWFTDKVGKSSTVKSLLFIDGSVAVESKSNLVTYYSYGERIKRPEIIAADGKPLEAGQTVWDVNTGDEFEVCELIQDDVVEVVVEYMNCGIAVHGRVNPETLTHERPESWERLEEDVSALIDRNLECAGAMQDYVDERGVKCPHGILYLGVVQDVLRRAKALAERGQ